MISVSLQSVKIVTATGDCVTANATENSELFWVMRGAGFSFGTIVSATYRVYDLTNKGQVVNADFLFPVTQSTAVFGYSKSLETSLPTELSLIF